MSIQNEHKQALYADNNLLHFALDIQIMSAQYN